MKLYVGTYTRPAPYLASTNGRGIYVLDYDEGAGNAGDAPGGHGHREPLVSVRLA